MSSFLLFYCLSSKKIYYQYFFFLFSTLYTINCYSFQIHCFFIFQWKFDCNRECWWPCSCYMEFLIMIYTFLNLLFSMFFILELFSFPFLTTYMELFWITDCEIYVFSITKDSHFQSMENKTFPYPCYILFKVLKVNALNTKSHTRY